MRFPIHLAEILSPDSKKVKTSFELDGGTAVAIMAFCPYSLVPMDRLNEIAECCSCGYDFHIPKTLFQGDGTGF